MGDSADLNKLYISWSNDSKRSSQAYTVYAAESLDKLYSSDSIICDITDNSDNINIITLPERAKGRYFAIRINECDDGSCVGSVYVRLKELALEGEHSSENYAVKSGYEMALTNSTSTQKGWMNDVSVTDKTNIIYGIKPSYIAYNDSDGTNNITTQKETVAAKFTNGKFEDAYISGIWKESTYLSDDTYMDIAWNFSEARSFYELWLAFRPEALSNPFYAVKYAVYAADSLDTLFTSAPIITVDENISNVNKISFNKRTARFFGIRYIVPNNAVIYGESNIRTSLIQLSLLGDYKAAFNAPVYDNYGNELSVTIEGNNKELFAGESVTLKAPNQYINGDDAYIFDAFYLNGTKQSSTINGDNSEFTVTMADIAEVKAVYNKAALINTKSITVSGGNELYVENTAKQAVAELQREYKIVSQPMVTVDGVTYTLYGWEINDDFVANDNTNEKVFTVKSNTVVKELYSASSGEYAAVFIDKSGKTLATYRIPFDKPVSEVVTAAVLAEITPPVMYGYSFSGQWSGDFSQAYNATVKFKPVYTQLEATYPFKVNGNKQADCRFDERVSLNAQSENFSAWKNGKSVLSVEKSYTLYAPGEINITESSLGSGNEVADYASMINAVTWSNSENGRNITVMCGLNRVKASNFKECGVLFTTENTFDGYGTAWSENFILGAKNTVTAKIIDCPASFDYMATLCNIPQGSVRYARAYVTVTVDGKDKIYYSSSYISCSEVKTDMPTAKYANAATEYSSHPLLPLYGDSTVPYYNAEYSKRTVLYSNDGSGNAAENTPTITPYIVDGAKSAIVIYPGGGYYARSDSSEGIAIAQAFNELGYSAFVVRYRVGNNDDATDGYNINAILADGQRGVQYVKANAERFGINPNKIAVCGFSAGGHLATMVSQHEHTENPAADLTGEYSSLPNAVILGYAVTTLKDGTFGTMPPILSGGDEQKKAEIVEKYSAQLNINDTTPPTFIWYGTADTAVNPQKNSVAYNAALQTAGITCEIHSYANVAHGVGLGKNTAAEGWHLKAADFLKKAGI